MKFINLFENIFNIITSKTSLHSYYLKKHISEFSKTIGKNSIVLDIGSATEPYKKLLCYENYISLDITKRGNIQILGDGCNLPLKKESVDVIICTEVIEHIQDTQKFLTNLQFIIKNNGYLILSVPFIMGVHEDFDFHRFTPHYLEKLLPEYGFTIINLKKRGGIFASFVQILAHIPYQLYGPYENKKNIVKFFSIFVYYLLLLPVIRIAIILDNFDSKKNYTLGYEVLCVQN